MNSLAALKSEYARTKEPTIKEAYDKLKEFIMKIYPEIGIPNQFKIL